MQSRRTTLVVRSLTVFYGWATVTYGIALFAGYGSLTNVALVGWSIPSGVGMLLIVYPSAREADRLKGEGPVNWKPVAAATAIWFVALLAVGFAVFVSQAPSHTGEHS